MNYEPGTWYNELYRIFSDNSLLTVAQTIKLGQCLRAIQAGENAEFHLNELYYSVRGNKVIAEALDEFIHAYIKHQQEVNNNGKGKQDFSEYQFIGASYTK